MGLFAETNPQEAALNDAARRRALTRERGTTRLIGGFIALLAVWYVAGKVQDHFLLQKQWPTLPPQPEGLTVVGTLDGRGNYDRNLFRIVNANKSSKVEITDYGWKLVFDGSSELNDSRAEKAVNRARDINGAAGDAMLAPILKAGVAREMGGKMQVAPLAPDQTITIPAQQGVGGTQVPAQSTTLGALVKKYSKDAVGNEKERDSDSTEGGSGSGREVEHGVTLAPDTLINACPIVLNGENFRGGELVKHEATAFNGVTYDIKLDLTPEGRSRFFQWSHDHANENLVFVLKHQVVAAGRIQDTMDVNNWEITNIRDAEGAHALVDYVNQSHK